MNTPTTATAVKAVRPLFAWALVAYIALDLMFAFLGWFVALLAGNGRQQAHYSDFVNLLTIGLPLLAVLVAAQIDPVLQIARFIAGIALIEYAFALLFGALTFLIGLTNVFGRFPNASAALGAFRYLVMGVAELGFMVLAAYAVLRVFLALGGRRPDMVARLRQTPPAQ
jgi:hypothetical protein